ncbi:septation protein 7 [[Candida] railenensis]|uniref:Septation protein 7 n=1 Tax=[Candida] railenensis TaxID=45579 RepID=A0A9P0QL30_9ASCO|nr:septation protein 7 [[Candida] railenensis]
MADQSYTFDSPSMTSHSPMINYRKDAKKGVKFTFMVVGESGTGKTTFVNCLLNKKVLSHRFESNEKTIGDTKTLAFTSAKSVALPNTSILTKNDFNPSTANEEPGIALTETKIEMIDDSNQKLLLNIIDAPGFGENLNNELCFVEIESYLKQQFDLVLAEETRIRRNPRFVDTRVHVLLYFITPTGHGLREIDILCMKRLSKYVNIIPVVGKADSFTEQELKNFKHQIKVDIEKFNVPTFQFDNYLSEYDEEEDYELIQECKYLAKIQPFAVIVSEELYEVKDNKTGESNTIRARQYPWGLIDVNNPKYSDFPILKSVLLGSHLQDLKDLTHDFLYETYRTERLTKVTGGVVDEDELEAGNGNGTNDFDHHNNSSYANGNTTVPSLSNLAQLTNGGANTSRATADHATKDIDETASVTSYGSKKQKSMLLDEDDETISEQNGASNGGNGHIPSPQLNHEDSFTSNTSISLDTGTRNPNFKRMSIGPQRNQLRQISETVPYVLRHERILERQQKLEEMEMASAKELATRAALLEQKAAELKAKERVLMKQLEKERLERAARQEQESATKTSQKLKESFDSARGNEGVEEEEEEALSESNGYQKGEDNEDNEEKDEVDEIPLTGKHDTSIKKDETLTDLHSIVEQH